MDFLERLLHSVRDLLQVDLADYIERIFSHKNLV